MFTEYTRGFTRQVIAFARRFSVKLASEDRAKWRFTPQRPCTLFARAKSPGSLRLPMNFERVPENLTKAVAILFAMLLALFCGKAAGSGQMGTVFGIVSLMLLGAGVLLLRENLWVLIPVCWPLTGKIPALGLPIAFRDLVVLYAAAGTLILMAFKVIRRRRQFTYLDGFLITLVLYLVIAFVRYPVGFASAGSAERVGGRPYYDLCIAFIAYLALGRAGLTPTIARRLPLIMLAVTMALAVVNALARAVPAIVPYVAQYYSGIDGSVYADQINSAGEGTERLASMMEFGRIGILTLCAAYRPLSLLNPAHFGRFLLFVIVAVGTLSSGFRNVIIWGGAVFLLSSYFRNGKREVFRIIVAGSALMLFLAIGQGRLFNLPFAAQRALSFIPGSWDQLAVSDAAGSADWRIQIWKEVFFTDRFIRDRVLGDGFGMTRSDYEITAAISERLNYRTEEESRLAAALAGDYHSGPLSILKVVGYVGGSLVYLILFLVMREAIRVIRKARSTPYFPFALLAGLPLIVEPFFYTLVFGGFSHLVPMLLLGVGMFGVARTAINENPPAPPVSPNGSDSLVPNPAEKAVYV